MKLNRSKRQLFSNYVIAEIGSVHDGSFGNALKLIDLAKSLGADAVKFQTHIAEFEVTTESPRPNHFSLENRFDYFKRTSFSPDDWHRLKMHAQNIGIDFLSSAFSIEAIDFLEALDVRAHKIPSGEVTNLDLVQKIKETGKPAILSTGMSNWKEIDNAMQILMAGASQELAVLQCTSAYPCPPERVGLNVLQELGLRYGKPFGLSDHSFGLAASIGAAALGASVIEKHLTFSREMYGSDAPYAMEPKEFSAMVHALHEVWAAIENPVNKDDLSDLEETRSTFQAVIVAAENLDKGFVLTRESIKFLKVGRGIVAGQATEILGRPLNRTIRALEPIEARDVV